MRIKKFHNSAALLLTLLVITIAGGTVLVVGRNILSSSMTSARYQNSIEAEEVAWAGIEDGLSRLKAVNDFKYYIPEFHVNLPSYPNWRGNFPASLQEDNDHKYIIRRNMSRYSTGNKKDEVAIAPDENPHDYVLDDFGKPYSTAVENCDGINYETPLPDSCSWGDSNCSPHSWDLNHIYYDLRVSASDDYSPSTSSSARYVNMSSGSTIVKKKGFYLVTKAEETASPNDFVDRIFDLTYYKGNQFSGTKTTDPNQKIYMRYHVEGLSSSESILITAFVKYKNNGNPNAHLSCHTPGTDELKVSDFYAKSVKITGTGSPVEQNLDIPIKRSCATDVVAEAVEYLGIRFRLTAYASGWDTTGCAACSVSFGLRNNNSATYPPFTDSFIGTGVNKIISTGIVGNIRKTFEVWAYKPGYVVISGNPGESLIKCINGSTNLQQCMISVDRISQ